MRDDGILFICDLTNQAAPGDMPKEVLSKVGKYWFENRTIGINRQYLAKGVNEQVDRLVRIVKTQGIKIGQYAVLGNGEQFRITMVTEGHEEREFTRVANKNYYKTSKIVGLDYTELQLMRVENYYDVQDS